MIFPQTVAPYDVFDLERITDDSGSLHVGELARRGIGSFGRIYLIAGVPHGGARGGHAHKEQAECLICVQGSLVVRVEAGGRSDVIRLARPGRALYLPPGYWRDLVDFSHDAIVAVLASDSFDESDYIRDRARFHAWESGAA